MQVTDDGNSGRINQWLYKARFPRRITVKDYVVKNTQTYRIKHSYNIHKHIITSADVMMMQW